MPTMPKSQRDQKRTLQVKSEATGYVAYFFRKDEQDPVVDSLRTMREDAGSPAINKIGLGCGVSPGTIKNWIDGKTRRPQFATINAAAGFFGYELVFQPKTRTGNGKKPAHAHAPLIIKSGVRR